MSDDTPATPRARPRKPRKPRATTPRKPADVVDEAPGETAEAAPETLTGDLESTKPSPDPVVEDAEPVTAELSTSPTEPTDAEPDVPAEPTAESAPTEPALGEPDVTPPPDAGPAATPDESAPSEAPAPVVHPEPPEPPADVPSAALSPSSPTPARTDPVTLAQALATDGVRRVVVTISYLFCLIGALTAFGVIDRSSPDGPAALSPSLSLLAPATQSGRIWWVVLLGLGGYVAWLWLPRPTADPRARAVAYRAAVAMGLLGLWFFVARTHWFVGSAVMGVVVVVSLMAALATAGRVPSRSFVGRQAVHLGLAVSLGWMVVVASAAVAGALANRHVPAYLVSAETWGILATTAILGAGMALLRYFPGRLYIGAALAWGFVWIAYARTMGQPRSYFLAGVASVSAVLILIAGISVFLWARGRVRDRVN